MLAASEAQSANAVPLPNRLDTPQFRPVWAEWCEHRTTLSTLNPLKLWTSKAAQSTLAECLRHGEKTASEAIQAAIANGWQGLVWERVLSLRKAMKSGQDAPSHGGRGYSGGGRDGPRNRAYMVADATRGLTPEQISGF